VLVINLKEFIVELTLIAVIYLDQMSQVVPSLLYLQPNFVGIHKSIGHMILESVGKWCIGY
jgi:hypothetical protein